ncbi:ExeM/NucH family extracellular endonuclease [Nocardioides marmotae]|uniref:ExeM/NucH family extracellular endonuclease n=1 Tax=Nocardioides marmotae TaxID=2663857 RepID=UPI0012B5C7CD|nr:ExeM/NucH family extracellular endonuclease [Nocardioides marmotae]MBC9733494.1 ExeM/NucH family extracellular endonuclease [Nocardioides marmotae]MTB84601.1 ExeM/NucH family extracellular endonuclease [Nocardioides marmotae]
MPSSGRSPRRSLAACAGLALAATGLSFAPLPAHAVSPNLVISEVYGGGGNTGAPLRSDFIELHNPTDAAVDLSGLTLEYRSVTNGSGGKLALSGTLAPGKHFLVKGADGNNAALPALPTPDATSTFNIAGTGGQVLVYRGASFTGAGNLAGATGIVDMVGWGANGSGAPAASYETAAAAATANATSVSRTKADADNNADEFTVGAPTPQSSGAGPVEPEPPADPVDATIPAIQGTGAASPLVGDVVTTTGVVTAVPQFLYGFYLQTPGTGAEADRTASDGVFVYYPTGAGAISVEPGDHVEVTGEVAEHAGQTQIRTSAAQVTELTTPAAAPVPYTGAWPATDAAKETLEGMLFGVRDREFTVADTYSTNVYGEVGLALGDTPLLQPTEVADPRDASAIAAVVADNAARAITLDDGSGTSFTSNKNLVPAYVSDTDPVRVGAGVTFVEDVILTEGGSTSAPTYRFQPLVSVDGSRFPATSPAVFEDTREAAPDASRVDPDGEAELAIASFNVLNYFTTLGDADDDNVGDDGCRPYTDRAGDGTNVNTGCDQRGAWDPEDFARQQEKIVAAINAMDADVVGLMEIENSLVLGEEADEATESLVAALNADAGSEVWAANPSSADLPPAAEMDVITNAIIYKPAAVRRVGEARALGELSGTGEAFDNAREPIAQVFTSTEGGEPFLFVVNHFKSKGSGVDDGTGQGNANPDRVRQAEALATWVEEVRVEEDVDAAYLLGDFNAYTMEDPIRLLDEAGYADVTSATGNDEYSYLFSGLVGSLDHVLANDAALASITGSDVWSINSGESIALEYSRFNYHGADFHAPGPYRSSDHDPVVVGIDTVAEPTDPGPVTPSPTDPPTPGPTDPTDPPTPGPTDPTEPPAPEPVKPTVRAFWYPQPVVAGRTRAVLTVKVDAQGEAADGWVRVSFPGKRTKVVKLEDGVLKVRLWKFGGAGDKTLTITYNGRGDVAARSIERVVRVVRR